MKFVKYLKYSLLGATALLMGGCADDTFHIDGPNDGEMPDELRMSLIIPAPVAVDLTRSGEFGVDNLYLFYYGESGYIQKSPVTLTPDNISTNEAGNTIVTVNVPTVGDATKLQVIINAPADLIGADSCEDPSTVWTDYFSNSQPILWGEAEIVKDNPTPTIALVRNTAIVTLKLDDAVQNFKIMEFGLFGTATEGSVAPADTVRATNSNGKLQLISKKPMISSSPSYPFTGPNGGEDELMIAWQAGNKKQSITGVFETPGRYKVAIDGTTFKNDSARIIFKGQYRDDDGATIDGYYVAAFCKQDKVNNNPNFSETPEYFKYGPSLDIIRQHEYILTITEVRSEGWQTLGQAVKAKPDNRTTYMVTDKSNAITDIEATRDYYLGVGGDVTTNYTGSVTIDVATTYPGLVENPTWKDRLVFESGEDDDWIHAENATLAADNDASDPTTFRIRIPLDQNNSPNDRYGFIKVRAGKLSRTIYLTQEGFPYSRQRKVTVSGIPGFSSTDNYYSWIEGTNYDANGIATTERADSVKGLTRAQNLGNVNRIGLHFPLVPLYDNVTYTIQGLPTDGEPSFVSGGSDFTYTRQGNNYIITLTNPDEIKSATGRFRIPAKAGDTDETINIDYDLFRTGVFHYLAPEYSQYQTPDESTHKSGWYYYEVVRVGNTYVLDRDLGASSNRPYTPGSSTYRKNIESVGGYFMVNTDRWANFRNNTSRREDQQTITAKLGLTAQTPSNGRFVPATENDIYGWGLDCSSVVSANITSGRVSGGKIYFPKAGYYEGEEKKSQMHTMLWSRTYLGGTQGLDPVKSNEYGYWYRYFDDMKSSNPENRYSNIRLARGSNGSAAVLGSSIYRYMPLRLVWVNSDCQNPYYSGNDDNNVVTGKIVVYVKNESQWTDVYYHVWGVSPGATTWGSLPKMTKVEGQTNLWRCEFGVPLSNRQDAGIMFGSRTNPGDNDGSKSGESKELYTRYNRGETVFYFTLKSNLALELTDSSDQDIYQNQNNTEYNYYILGTSSTFFTADNSQRKALVKSGSNYVLSEMACEASTFMIEVRDKATDAYVKVLRGTISSGNVNLGTQMDVTDKSTADGATNWKLPTADAYTFTFNPQTMKLRVNRIGVSNDYDYYLHGVPVGGWTENNLLKFKFNTTTKVYEIKDATLVSGEFGIRVCTLNDANKTKQDWLYSPNSSLTPIVVNTAMPVVSEKATSGKNWNLTKAGKYDITFDPAAMTITFTQEEREVYYRLVNGPNGNATQYMTNTKFAKSGNKYVLTQQPLQAGDIKVEEVAVETDEVLNTYWSNTASSGRNIELKKEMPGQDASSGGGSWYAGYPGYFDITFDPENITLKLTDNIPTGKTVNINFRSNAIVGTSGWTERRMTNKNGIYVFENIQLGSGQFEFIRYADDYKCCTFLAKTEEIDYTIGTTGALNHFDWQPTGYNTWNITGGNSLYNITFNLDQETFKIERVASYVEDDYSYALYGTVWDGSTWKNNGQLMKFTGSAYEFDEVYLQAGNFGIQRLPKGNASASQLAWLYAPSSSGAAITIGQSKPVVVENNSNGTNFQLSQSGTYHVVFDPVAMTLTLEPVAISTTWTLYIQSNKQPYIYMWKNNTNYQTGGWPGDLLTTTEVINGTTYYVRTIPRDFDGLKFNDDASETGELKPSFFNDKGGSTANTLRCTLNFPGSGASFTIVGTGKP